MKTSAVCGILGAALSALLPLLAAGCSGKAEEARGNTYTVRALVENLPNQGSGLYLTHEAIDNWVGRSGKIVGMSTMTMPFPMAEDVSLEGIEPGDKIEVQLHVDWEADLPIRITGLRELPRDTELDFRVARPPSQDPEEGN